MIVPMPNKGEGAELLWELALWACGWEGLDFGSRLVCTLYPGGYPPNPSHAVCANKLFVISPMKRKSRGDHTIALTIEIERHEQ